jgi:hypothetical protein
MKIHKLFIKEYLNFANWHLRKRIVFYEN